MERRTFLGFVVVAMVAGSARRGAIVSSDIDVLLLAVNGSIRVFHSHSTK